MTSMWAENMAHITFSVGKPDLLASEGKGPSSHLPVVGKDPLTHLLAIPSHHLVLVRPEIPFSLTSGIRNALPPILQIWETPPLADFLY